MLALLLFGGETLQDFAFALIVGIASGTYSSIFIATPVLTHWKEREPVYRARRAPHPRDARLRARRTRRPTQGGPVDVAPKERGGRRSVTAPPGQEVSRAEFQEMVRDLGVEEASASATPPARGQRPRGASRRRAPRARPGRRRHRRRRRPTGGTPADGGNGERRRRRRTESRATAGTGGRADGLLVWVMVGLALWHFTVFLPDHFYGGIVGAFCGALLGSIIFGLIVNLGSIPGESDTDLLTGVEAIPGALLGIGLVVVARRAPDGAEAPQPSSAHRRLGAAALRRPTRPTAGRRRRSATCAGRSRRRRSAGVSAK